MILGTTNENLGDSSKEQKTAQVKFEEIFPIEGVNEGQPNKHLNQGAIEKCQNLNKVNLNRESTKMSWQEKRTNHNSLHRPSNRVNEDEMNKMLLYDDAQAKQKYFQNNVQLKWNEDIEMFKKDQDVIVPVLK